MSTGDKDQLGFVEHVVEVSKSQKVVRNIELYGGHAHRIYTTSSWTSAGRGTVGCHPKRGLAPCSLWGLRRGGSAILRGEALGILDTVKRDTRCLHAMMTSDIDS